MNAYEFAKQAHGNQKRKYTGEPYINHPAEVAEIVEFFGVGDKHMIEAAFLHDVLEDTAVTEQELRRHFHNNTVELVVWLTDVSKPSDGNRAQRKRIDREHIAKAPARAKTIKLADLISNTRSIIQHDRKFARVYLREKRLLLDVLHDGDSQLWEWADRILKAEGY